MRRSPSRNDAADLRVTPSGFDQRLQEIDLFFAGRGREHQTMRRVAKRLDKARIRYAIVGGMAVNAHHFQQTTGDVDMLLTAEGFAEFRRLFVPKNYEPIPGRRRRFVDRSSRITLGILVTGLFPGTGKPGPIAFPDPAVVSETIDNLPFVDLATLIQLKLAARRHRDFGDVVGLIRHNDLDETFADRLHPSLKPDYIECLEEKRREDEFEALNG